MEIVTSWMEKGIEQGMEQGIEQGMEQGMERGIEQGMEQGMEQGVKQGKLDLVLRQLGKRLGSLEPKTEARIAKLSVEQLEELAEALLDFEIAPNLTVWLDAHVPQ